MAKLIRWYRALVPDCLITVYDNMSTDNTAQICANNAVVFRQFDTGDKMAEEALIQLRNTAWKATRAKFAIVCDSDELVDISESQLLACGNGEKWNLCKCHGVELFGHDADLQGEFWGMSMKVSRKSTPRTPAVQSMNFFEGRIMLVVPVPESQDTSKNGAKKKINLYHTKWQSWEKGLVRQNEIKKQRHIPIQSKTKGGTTFITHLDSPIQEYFAFRNRLQKKRRRFSDPDVINLVKLCSPC